MDAIFVVAIVAIVMVFGSRAMVRAFEHRERMASRPSERVQAELEQLKERVQVLERIVTDERFELRRALDALDDDR
jgi:hypothetical protein